MPTYEYACTECGERIEVSQRITDEPLRVCEVCGGALRKLFHPAGIVFKGSGFYKTDYPSKKAPARADGRREKGSGEKGSGEKGSGEKGSGEKGSGEKGGGSAAKEKSA